MLRAGQSQWGVFSSHVWLPKVLPWTNWDSFPRWDAGHSIALASFHSVMTHRQKRKMNNSLDRLPWFVFFCGWLVGRCFSLAVHCSVECSVWLFGFDLILTRCQVAVPASAQADQAAASSDPPIQVPDQAALAAAHAEGTCDRGLYQGTNLQLGWCGYGWVDHVKRHPSHES